jgi:hypothetical protein
VLGSEVGRGPRRCPGRFAQSGSQRRVALAGPLGVTHAGGFVVARTQARPGGPLRPRSHPPRPRTRRLHHPGARPRIHAAQPWLATVYVPGPTLHRYVTAHGPLHGGALLSLAAGVAEAPTTCCPASTPRCARWRPARCCDSASPGPCRTAGPPASCRASSARPAPALTSSAGTTGSPAWSGGGRHRPDPRAGTPAQPSHTPALRRTPRGRGRHVLAAGPAGAV